MKRFLSTLLIGFLTAGSMFAQQEIYKRTLINLPAGEPSSFGGFVAGVDLDGDGKLEVYAVNNDWNDVGQELIPTLYKFEQNASGGWDSVWSWKSSNIPLQNTWPSLTVGDLDNDGRKEIIWGPINNTGPSNTNPARILVFESVPGQDSLGVNGGPNTSWTISDSATTVNIRPFRFLLNDFDHDGKPEIIFPDRGNSIYRFAVIGVNDVPNDGNNAGVVWSKKYEGIVKDTNINAGTYYDAAIIDSTVFFINTSGNVQPLSYANGVYTLRKTQLGVVPGGSWKTSVSYDLDNDGKKEIIVGGWTSTAANKKIHILKMNAGDSTLTESAAIDVSAQVGSGQIYGGAIGDIDNDGKPDYVFGTRDADAKVFRMEYQGGGIGTPANYTVTEIDRHVVTTATRLDEIALANVDGVAGDEVFYSNSTDGRVPIVILSNGKKAHWVTFNANTAGVPDTLKANSTVQIRGANAPLTWDNNSIKMTNKGGDYWSTQLLFAEGDTVVYKYFTNAKSSITGSDNGWEGDTKDWGNGNRRFIMGTSDTTSPVEFVNGFSNNYMQWDAPFAKKTPDSVVAYLRVNMQSYPDFNPATMKIGVRGSFPASGWGNSVIMKQEQPHPNGGSQQYGAANFYSVPVYWRKSLLDTATNYEDRVMRFKFVIHKIDAPTNEDWSLMVDNPNFQIEFSMPAKDTTVYWQWYRGIPYVAPKGSDSATVKFNTDLTTAITQKGVKPGDTIVVKYGFGSTAELVYADTLHKVGVTGNVYESNARKIYKISLNNPIQYQYYLEKPGNEIRELYYDFGFTGSDPSAAEKRKFTVATSGASMTVFDTSKSISQLHRQPIWQNTGKLARNVNVTFTCDLRPAYYTLLGGDSLFDVQGASGTLTNTEKDSVYKWGVWINGPAVGGWSNGVSDWGVGLRSNLAKKMYDDGTHGDKVAGDHIYSIKVKFYKDSVNNTIGQVFKFGLNGGDNEGGKGGYGNNHAENIDDADTIATIASQFGSINPTYYRFWNYDKMAPALDVQRSDVLPIAYSLDQNFPNPFNPTTTIQYSIPNQSQVVLKIYNMLGQEVATLVNESQNTGKYTVNFNASRFASGVYIYRLEAGSFTSVKKMLLLK